MSKVAVVYWSGTGNTEAMARAVAEGVESAGADVELLTASEFDGSKLGDYDAVAFGCPSMGVEVLEESEFQPMWDTCKGNLSGKKIALFGSYDWGDGEWMRTWEEEAKGEGVSFASDYVICNNEPDDEGLENCKALGASLA